MGLPISAESPLRVSFMISTHIYFTPNSFMNVNRMHTSMCICNKAMLLYTFYNRKEVCNTKNASRMLITSAKKSPPILVCSSGTSNASLTLQLQQSDATTITLYNSYSRKLQFNVKIAGKSTA